MLTLSDKLTPDVAAGPDRYLVGLQHAEFANEAIKTAQADWLATRGYREYMER